MLLPVLFATNWTDTNAVIADPVSADTADSRNMFLAERPFAGIAI